MQSCPKSRNLRNIETYTKPPFFSIIIPVYNSSSTLKRCVDSVLNQDFCDFEVICIDDGSSDNCFDMLKTYESKDSRLRCLSQHNQGPASVRNRGMREAKGSWLLFVDSDDYLCNEKCFGTLHHAICACPDCEMVCFSGTVATKEGTFPDAGRKRVYDSGCQCMEDNCLKSRGVVFGSVFVQCYRKSVIDGAGIRFDDQLWYAEDRLFVCSCFLCAGTTIMLPDVLYCYVVNDNSLMNDENRKKRLNADQRKAVKQIEKRMEGKGKDLPRLRKYIHGLYVKSIDDLKRNEIDWRFVFRNASTLKLKIKDVLLFLGVNKY